MNHTPTPASLNLMYDILKLLSQSPQVQYDLMPKNIAVEDEIALLFEDAFLLIPSKRLNSLPIQSELLLINEALKSMPQEGWDSLHFSAWDEIRFLARKCLMKSGLDTQPDKDFITKNGYIFV